MLIGAWTLGCGGAAPPSAAPKTAQSQDEGRTPLDAAPTSTDTSEEATAPGAETPEEPAPVYTEPPPQVVRRHHVFATLKARAKNKVVITSVLTTAADEAETLSPDTEALLEFKAKGSKEWVAVADVIVKKVSTKGSRAANNERQEIELEIKTEHPAAGKKGKENPFQRNGRVRLQVDRPEPAGAAP